MGLQPRAPAGPLSLWAKLLVSLGFVVEPSNANSSHLYLLRRAISFFTLI